MAWDRTAERSGDSHSGSGELPFLGLEETLPKCGDFHCPGGMLTNKGEGTHSHDELLP